MTKVLTVSSMLVLWATLSACSSQTVEPTVDEQALEAYTEYLSNQNPVVSIEIADVGTMRIELFPSVAPNSVRNFVNLVESGYFDGVGFHRVIENFMIQGGQGAPLSCRITGEFNSNGFPNPLAHTRGVISMARTMDPNSATGQFFIVHKSSPHLNGQYAAFGALLDGFNFLDLIAETETGAEDRPVNEIVITQMTVDTKGIEYPAADCHQ